MNKTSRAIQKQYQSRDFFSSDPVELIMLYNMNAHNALLKNTQNIPIRALNDVGDMKKHTKTSGQCLYVYCDCFGR